MTEEKQTEYNPPLIRRAHLAVFFGGIIASITVTIIGMLGVMIWSIISGGGSAPAYQSGLDVTYVFFSMLSITFIISAFNLALFFIVIPVAWTLLGLLSMMFKAEHRPQPPVKFYHVGIVSTSLAIFLASMAVGADFVATNTPQYLFAGVSGAALAAFAIGIPAGFLTVFAYRVILRPPAYPAP